MMDNTEELNKVKNKVGKAVPEFNKMTGGWFDTEWITLLFDDAALIRLNRVNETS